ncbi:MAG: hypothetical protein ACOX2F_03220 [bacterium]
MNLDKIIGKIFIFLFVISIFSSFFFFAFFSDSSGVDEATELAFGKILNERFEQGDIVFPEVDWDLRFLKHINPGIHPIYLTLKETTKEDIRMMKEDGGEIFFLLKDEKNWEEISKRTGVVEKERIKAGSGLVIVGSDGREAFRKPLVFSRDIGEAKSVRFSKNGADFPCTKSLVSKWQCGKSDWNYVGATTAVMGGKQQKAVWAHPLSDKTLHIAFELPGEGKTIFFKTAFLETAYRSQNKSPVEVELFVDGVSVLSYLNESVRAEYANKVSLPVGGKELEIQLKTENAGQRHFVFNGYVE